MVDLAELRVHLRNEHVREGRVKARLKRKTTTYQDTTTDGADLVTTTRAEPVNDQAEPQLAIANADDSSIDEDQEHAASAFASGSLQGVATRHSHTEADEPSPQEAINSRRIADIFDFTTDTWRQLAKEFEEQNYTSWWIWMLVERTRKQSNYLTR
ncbi:hypothetical protein LshimejAT787_0404400 [Lyophyllum shimeji]|uniref:Uncharacterized protein n=1 Tax=Lyophyllum shimeji TaxID=47721 RepID=A0A9P3UJW0_LYOSH|nr:hypothetical protein LshimejAT787_0404400 [Lyophyllum shimeji]